MVSNIPTEVRIYAAAAVVGIVSALLAFVVSMQTLDLKKRQAAFSQLVEMQEQVRAQYQFEKQRAAYYKGQWADALTQKKTNAAGPTRSFRRSEGCDLSFTAKPMLLRARWPGAGGAP